MMRSETRRVETLRWVREPLAWLFLQLFCSRGSHFACQRNGEERVQRLAESRAKKQKPRAKQRSLRIAFKWQVNVSRAYRIGE